MPIYEYLCLNCGQVFERLLIGKEMEVGCPSCPGAPVEKQFSTFSFRGEGSFVPSIGRGGSCCATPSS